MNKISESNLLQALSLAIQLCEAREMEQVRRTEEITGRKQPEFKSTYRAGLESNLNKAIKGEKLVIA